MQRITRAQAANRAACGPCHQRKVKCDAHDVGIPCSNCKHAARDDCRIHQKRKRVSKSALAQNRIINEPLDGLSISVATTPSPSSPAATHRDDERSAHSTPASAGVTGVNILAAEEGEYIYKRHLVEFIDQPELIERPIDSKARTTYIGTDVSNINFLVRHQFGAQVHAADVCHYPTNRISRRLASGPADRLPLDSLQLPPRALVDELLSAYFTHVNPGFPVVDERLFLNQYRARDPLDPPSLLLLHSILVVGAHVLYHRDREKRDSCKLSFYRRAKSLIDAGFERNRDTIVQAALLLTWHTDGVEDVAANAWFWLGIAVRTATGLGMHRDADGSTLVTHNKRMWRRVWWLLFQTDVWISLQYGRPQSIHLEDSNVKKLKASDFDDCGDNARTEYVMQMSELAVIVSNTLRARSRASTPEASLAVLQQMDEKLAGWTLRLPQQLHHHITSHADVWCANLHLHYNTVLILFHRSLPHSNTATDAKRRDENSEICVAAAGIIQSIFQNLCETANLRCLWMSTINCLFTALIQLSTEIRLTNPLLAISALRRYDSALVSLKRLAEYWPNAESILHFFEKSIQMNAPPETISSYQKPAGGKGRAFPGSNRVSDAQKFSNTLSPGELDPSYISQQQLVNDHISKFDDMSMQPQPHVAGDETSSMLQLSPQQSDQHLDENRLSSTEEILNGWKHWQNEQWQTPEFSNEFLFTF